MEESNEQDGMVEILDLENDMIDGYVSEETEGMVFCIPWIFQFPKPNFSVLLSFIAQLTTILEYNDENEDFLATGRNNQLSISLSTLQGNVSKNMFVYSYFLSKFGVSFK